VYAGIKVVLPKELGRSSRNVSQFVRLVSGPCLGCLVQMNSLLLRPHCLTASHYYHSTQYYSITSIALVIVAASSPGCGS
jgi:hypothetical protein